MHECYLCKKTPRSPTDYDDKNLVNNIKEAVIFEVRTCCRFVCHRCLGILEHIALKNKKMGCY